MGLNSNINRMSPTFELCYRSGELALTSLGKRRRSLTCRTHQTQNKQCSGASWSDEVCLAALWMWYRRNEPHCGQPVQPNRTRTRKWSPVTFNTLKRDNYYLIAEGLASVSTEWLLSPTILRYTVAPLQGISTPLSVFLIWNKKSPYKNASANRRQLRIHTRSIQRLEEKLGRKSQQRLQSFN